VAKDVLINSLDLSGSILMGSDATESCCDAMQDVMKAGHILHIARTHSAGMTVRFLLPRESVALHPNKGSNMSHNQTLIRAAELGGEFARNAKR